MERLQLFGARRVDVSKDKHVFKPVFPPIFVTAAAFECLWVLEGAEENVPKRNVGKVIGVMTKLVMDPMGFGTLKDEAEPGRGVDVPVIEEFADGDEDCVIGSRLQAGPEQRKKNQAAQEGVDPDLDRMFVKAGDDLESLGRNDGFGEGSAKGIGIRGGSDATSNKRRWRRDR